MDRKNAGIEYDREAFIPAADRLSDSNPSLRGVLVLVASIAAIIALAFLGYKIVAQSDVGGGSPSDSRVLGQLDQRLSGIEQRLEQLEQENHRRTYAFPAPSPKADAPAAASAPAGRVSTEISSDPDAEDPRGRRCGRGDTEQDCRTSTGIGSCTNRHGR